MHFVFWFPCFYGCINHSIFYLVTIFTFFCGHKSAGKLAGKTAIITGGDSGIGKSVAIYFAKEGADVVISYLEEHQDAGSRALIDEEAEEL